MIKMLQLPIAREASPQPATTIATRIQPPERSSKLSTLPLRIVDKRNPPLLQRNCGVTLLPTVTSSNRQLHLLGKFCSRLHPRSVAAAPEESPVSSSMIRNIIHSTT
jgi:hypothetical protein